MKTVYPVLSCLVACILLGCAPTGKDVRAFGSEVTAMLDRGQFRQAELAIKTWGPKLKKNPELSVVWMETMGPIGLGQYVQELNVINGLAKDKDVAGLKTGDWSNVGKGIAAARIEELAKIAPSP